MRLCFIEAVNFCAHRPSNLSRGCRGCYSQNYHPQLLGAMLAQKLTPEQSAAMLDASLSVVSTLLLAASIESLLKGLILVNGGKAA